MNNHSEPSAYRVLVYGLDRKKFSLPKDFSPSKKYTLEFAPYKTPKRFQEYDGVITFQGMFESFERISSPYSNAYWSHKWDRDELDKRTKEALALVAQGGFLCLILTDPFIDSEGRSSFHGTDLAKRLIPKSNRLDFSSRVPTVTGKVNELLEFFRIHGAAWSQILVDSKDNTTKVLASAGDRPVATVANGRLFIIPSLVPEFDEASLKAFFEMLADGVVSLWEGLQDDLPRWAAEYRFTGEAAFIETKRKLSEEISKVDEELASLDRLKRVLVLSGEPLVDAVSEIFDRLLPLKPRRYEAFREDLELLNSAGNVVAFVEVKGVNRGVSREHVNQADSHRERNEKPPTFPSLLIINTFRNATSLAEKDKPPATEQVRHAVQNNVLILRTLDLLNLASLLTAGKIQTDRVVELLTTSRGWLKVGDSVEVTSE